MLDLYVNIRKRRKELGMSQDELAKKVGYTSRSTIARIESGEIDISRSKILAFAKALKTTPSDLMGWQEELDREIEIDSKEDVLVKLSEDSELYTLVERAEKDTRFRQRLLGIVKLMENDK